MWHSSSPGVPSFATQPLALSALPAGTLRIIYLKHYLKFIATTHYSYYMYEIRARAMFAADSAAEKRHSGSFESCL
jgi:hypothetical protein